MVIKVEVEGYSTITPGFAITLLHTRLWQVICKRAQPHAARLNPRPLTRCRLELHSTLGQPSRRLRRLPMGTGPVPLKVNSKGRKNFECMEEMHAYMQCFTVRHRCPLLAASREHPAKDRQPELIVADFRHCSVLALMETQREET